MKKVVIVGGVAGGASTATRLRRLSEDYEIVILEKGDYPSFANCGLPYHIGGVIPEREALLIQTVEKFWDRFRIEVRIGSEVLSVNTEKKYVEVEKDGKRYEEDYDVLVLSPGAKAFRPGIPGLDSPRVHSLKTIPDMDGILEEMKTAKSVAVLGGGFIGVEAAENLKERGLETHLIEGAPHIMAPFDSEFSSVLEGELMEKGVKLHLGAKVLKVEEGDGLSLSLEGGERVEVDFVVAAMGVRPATDFLKDAGIALGSRGEILVNDYLETNVDSVYALGDAIPGVALAGPANRQGRIVANNIHGKRREKYKGSMGCSIIKVFDMEAASVGKNARSLKNEGVSFEEVLLYPFSHAGYYPNATQLQLKVLYAKEDGKILGAQALGYDSVAKSIDTLAACMHFGGTIYDLEELELAYAPPFGSAKSVLNMAGFIGANLYEGLVEAASREEVLALSSSQILLDVRTPEEAGVAPVKHSYLLPLHEIRDRMAELPKEKEIFCFCSVGLRGYIASRILVQAGYKVKNILGGYRALPEAWKKKEEGVVMEVVKEKTEKKEMEELNLTGLSCPGPLMKLQAKMLESGAGDNFHVIASDPAFANDVAAWAKSSGNTLHRVEKKKGFVHAYVEKAGALRKTKESLVSETADAMSIVVFSGDYDKAIAAFVIANGALAMGKKVTMFFTFWGLSILKKEGKFGGKKSFLDRLFGFCLPSSWKKLPLSKMNFLGMGPKMMQHIMKKKDLVSLEGLREDAKKGGAQIIACSMSMEAMGITAEELMDDIDYGGVAQYLGETEGANPNLFI